MGHNSVVRRVARLCPGKMSDVTVPYKKCCLRHAALFVYLGRQQMRLRICRASTFSGASSQQEFAVFAFERSVMPVDVLVKACGWIDSQIHGRRDRGIKPFHLLACVQVRKGLLKFSLWLAGTLTSESRIIEI